MARFMFKTFLKKHGKFKQNNYLYVCRFHLKLIAETHGFYIFALKFRNPNLPVQMKFFILLIFLALLSSITTQAQAAGKFDPSNYVSVITKERKQKDIEMLTDDKSPIPNDEKATFKKLNYYKPKTKFRKEAKFTRFDQATRFLMKTTTERLPEYSLYGVVNFKYKGKNYSLNVYQNIELVKRPGYDKHLFVPFNDETNEKETYGGGRFLDLTETGSDTMVIDFNLAYNPYCAYNHKYSCPIPPKENNLEIKITAGEKKWHK